jgi:hypothetical protein
MPRISVIIAVVLLCASCVSALRNRTELLRELRGLYDIQDEISQLTNGTIVPIPRIPNFDACLKVYREAIAAVLDIREWEEYIEACRHFAQQTCLPRKTMIRKLLSRRIQYALAYELVREFCVPKVQPDEYDASEKEMGDV